MLFRSHTNFVNPNGLTAAHHHTTAIDMAKMAAYGMKNVLIAHNTAFEKPSVVQLEQIFTIDKSRVQRFLGRLTQDEMQEIEKGVVSSLDLNELFFKIKTVSI